MIDKNSIISEHLPYEINMMRYAYHRLQSPPREQPEANAFIECFCIHARNLLDFFWDKKPKRKNHAVARDFTDPRSTYNPFEGKSPKKNPIYGKLNDQIVHITYGRSDNEIDKIDGRSRVILKVLIEKEIGNFLSHIEAPYMDLWQRREEKLSLPRGPQGTTTTSVATAVGATGPFMAPTNWKRP